MNLPLSNTQAALAVALMGVITLALRALPFLLFSQKNRAVPTAILYLGQVLPYASMVLLVVYCFRNLDVQAPSALIPAVAGTLSVVLLQVWRKNSTISIFGGTVIYMLTLQLCQAL